jgi:hypothetical protein
MSTAKFNQWLNSDGSENYKCRAWVNFNGTGTVAIRASGNVSSITDNGTGNYRINFTTAMPDDQYSLSGTARTGTTSPTAMRYVSLSCANAIATDISTTSVTVVSGSANGSIEDLPVIMVQIIR